MSTSLREQLQRLAVPQTTALADARTKASILFDRKEAAGKDRRTIFELGCNGLQELTALNPTFQQFQLTLFDENSLELERAVEQSDVNKLLDKNIRKFLQHLSPYFLLRPAHMCLEWLLRRFQVHEYNREDLLALCIPYHETNSFVRVIQTFRIRQSDTEWAWLRPLQKPGLPLSKTAILNRAASNSSFLKFVCESTLSAVRELGARAHLLQAQLNFYASVVVGAWEHAGAIQEWHITTILPSLLHALSSQTIDFVSAAYIIAAQLLRRTQLTSKLCNALLVRVAAVSFERLRPAAVLLLILIFDSQTTAQPSFNEKTLLVLMQQKWFTLILAALAKDNVAIEALCMPIIRAGVTAIQSDHEETVLYKLFLERLLYDVQFPDATAAQLISCFLNVYIAPAPQLAKSNSKKPHAENDIIEIDSDEEMPEAGTDFQAWYADWLRKLELQYPNAFDETIKQALKASNAKETANYQQALKMALGFRLKSCDENTTDIYESLYHHTAQIRLFAIQQVLSHLSDYRQKPQNYQLLRECLADRIRDDSELVVAAVLELATKDFIDILGCGAFVESLFHILNKMETNGNEDWLQLQPQLLQHLTSSQVVQNYDTNLILLALMPTLFPDSSSELTRECISIVLKSALSEKVKFLQELKLEKSKGKRTFSAIEFKKHFIDVISQTQAAPTVQTLIESLQNARQENAPLFKNVKNFSHFLLLLTACLKQQQTAAESLKILQLVCGNCKQFKIKYLNRDEPQKHDFLSLQLFSDFVKTLTLRTQFKPTLAAWSADNTADLKCIFIILDLLTHEAFSQQQPQQKLEWSKVLKETLDVIFKTPQSKIEFFINFYIYAENEYASSDVVDNYAVLRVRAFKLVSALLKNKEHKFKLSTMHIMKMANALNDPCDVIRLQALETLKDAQRLSNLEEMLLEFIGGVLERSNEIAMDHEQFPLIFFTILQPTQRKKQTVGTKILREILQWLREEAQNMQTPVFDAQLLRMLKHMNNERILGQLIPLAIKALAENLRTADAEHQQHAAEAIRILKAPYSQIYQMIIERFDAQTIEHVLVEETETQGWQLLQQLFAQYNVFMVSEDKLLPVPCVALECFDEHTYEHMPSKHKVEFLKLLIKTIAAAENDTIFLSANKLLKKCTLSCKSLVALLENMFKKSSVQPAAAAAKLTQRKSSTKKEQQQPTNNSSSKNDVTSSAWKEGVVLLELLENKKKLSGTEHIIAPLFELLKVCLEMEDRTAIEYPKQLTLSALLHCCQKSKADGIDLQATLPKSTFRIDQIVQCMRATQNPQTHNNALLLLSHCASLFPQQVLHNIVDIFTFMGSSVVRHDDVFSFQIINNIIESIIPILVQRSSSAKTNNVDVDNTLVIPVLKVFSDILLDVPEHRRLPLYTKLLHTLGASQYLWIFLCVVFEAHVIDDEKQRLLQKKSSSNKPNASNDKLSKRLEIALQLMAAFTPQIVLENCIQLMQYIKQLPLSKDNASQQTIKRLSAVNATELTLFDVKCRSAKQLRHYKYVIMQFLSAITSSPEFLKQISTLSPSDQLEMKSYYQNFILKILSFVPVVNAAIEKSEEVSQTKFWKVISHHVHDVLDNAISLLSPDMFLLVVSGLMQHQLLSIRRKVIELLIGKLQLKDSFFDACDEQNFYNLLKPLTDIVSTILQRDEAAISGISSPSTAAANEIICIQQTALVAIKLLSKLFALKYIEEFKNLLSNLTKIMKRRSNISKIVLATVVLTIIEISSNLKAHSLAFLPKYMPQLIEILQDQAELLRHHAPDNVCIAIITGIQKLFEALPLFLGPYIVDIITALSSISTRIVAQQKDKDQRSTLALHKITIIWTRVASEVPARIIVPSCEKAYHKLLAQKNYADIGVLMKLLNESISKTETSDLQGVQNELSDFFVEALEFRLQLQSEQKSEIIATTESFIIEAFVTWVLKLSESSFRPLYHKVYEWAFKQHATEKAAILTFFLLTNKIAEALKSLFVLFASDFIEDTAALLNSCNTNNAHALNSELLSAILSTLFNIFLHDSKGFISAQRFETLMQPIVEQFENSLVLENEMLQKTLSACIAQLAVCVSNDVLWKQLNYQVLLKTRSNVPEVRVLAFNCCVAIARKLGDDFTPLLPETVPFIAELFEDENARVEKNTRKSVQELETILGESLQKYL